MEVITDILGSKNIIMDSINKHGHAPEHNFWYFYNLACRNEKCTYFRFENDCAIMAVSYKNSSSWMISEVLAPDNDKLKIFEEFLAHALLKLKLKKVFVLVSSDFRKRIQKMAKGNYHLSSSRTYYSPVFNLKKFDENLPGKSWKKIRNIKNRFYRENKVDVVPSSDIKKSKLKDIVTQWNKNKKWRGRAEIEKYLNFIDNGFEGAKYARTLVIDGKPSTITAGWDVPNSSVYYSAIGMHNYKYKYLSEIANLDDLIYLKKMRNYAVNLGTSDKSLLTFKKKFMPQSILKSHYFSIRRGN